VPRADAHRYRRGAVVWQGGKPGGATPVTGSEVGWPHDAERGPGIHSLGLLKFFF